LVKFIGLNAFESSGVLIYYSNYSIFLISGIRAHGGVWQDVQGPLLQKKERMSTNGTR